MIKGKQARFYTIKYNNRKGLCCQQYITNMSKQKRNLFLILLAICIVSLISFIGLTLFNTRGEPREAIVSLSMLKYGNWILPVNNGIDIAYKPPLLHWLIASISYIYGEVTPFTSRMPSAIALIAMIIASYFFFAKRKDAMTAFITGIITLTCFEVHRAGTSCRVDMLLSALMVIALYQLHKWGEKDMKGIPFWGILAMSGAFLTKGPVGILLPCLVEFVYLLIRGAKPLKLIGIFVFIGLSSCILPALWYFAAYRQGGDKFLELIYEENVLRFLGKMSYASHEKPAYYNFITLIAGYVPYTLLVVISLFTIKYKPLNIKGFKWWSELKAKVLEMDSAHLFSLLSIVIIFIFYCIPKSKRSVYLLPIYPFIAFFLAEYIIYLAKRHSVALKVFGNIMAVIAILLTLCFIAVRLNMIPESLFSGKHAIENINMMRDLANADLNILSIIILAVPLVASCIFWHMRHYNSYKLILSVLGIIWGIFISLDGFYQPVILGAKSDYDVAMKIKNIVPQGRIYSYRTDIVVGDRMHPFTINFYLGDRVAPFDSFNPATGYLIAGNDDIDTFKKTYTSYDVEEVCNFNHRSCDDKKWLHLYKFNKRNILTDKISEPNTTEQQ